MNIAVIKHNVERTDDMKPTKEQFQEYVDIRDSGITNMFDIPFITSYSKTGLNRDICVYIMKHFEELAQEYEVEI